ncbi:MAG: CDP-glucose 4,6-dehydratase [Ignavibacteria bacterium]|nr:CDP-glucose 4,6-dehydratase [Ignavibacteria bacterium]
MIKKMQLFNDIYNGKKVLLTGDSGFKGSWLAIWLREAGADVYGYSLPPKSSQDNFVTCNLASRITHQDGDIRDQKMFQAFVEKVQPDIMFHLAAQPLVLESYEDPRYTFETNVMGTVNFFEAARSIHSVKAAINITTDKCYQNNEWIWGYKETDPLGGKDPYSASKAASEIVTGAYSHSFFRNGETHIASVRAGNVIGGGDWADYRIVPDFFRSLKEQKELYLRFPQATRPWQFVLEPLAGYLLLGQKLLEDGKEFSGSWNFGPAGFDEHPVEELVRELIVLAGKGSYAVDLESEKKHEATLLKLDISKAQRFLQWMPVLNFKETMQFVFDGYIAEENNDDVYTKRVEQIQNYIQTGRTKGIRFLG